MIDKAQSGTYFKVPLSDVIFEASQYLQIKDTNTDGDFLEILAWRAVKRLNAISSLITDVKTIKVCNGEAILPTNLFRFLWFTVCQPDATSLTVDGTNSNPVAYPVNFIYVDTPFLSESCGCDLDCEGGQFTPVNYQTVVRINNGKLLFSNKHFLYFDKIRVAGIYYATDSNGVFVVNDNMVPAIVYRICHEYAVVNIKKYDKYQIEDWRRQALSMSNKVRSDDFKMNFQNNIDQVQAMYRGFNYAPLVSRNRSRY